MDLRKSRRRLAAVAAGAALVLVASLTADAATTAQKLAGGDSVTVHCDGAALTASPVDPLTMTLGCAPATTTTTVAPPTTTTVPPTTTTLPPTTTTTAPPLPTTTTTLPPPPPPPPTSWPGPTNTGVPSGTVLHACSSPITQPGTYDSCRWASAASPTGLSIRSSGVKITRSLINGQVTGLNQSLQGASLTDTTIACNCPSTDNTTPPAIAFSDFTLTRVNVFGSGHGVQIVTNVVVQDSYIHGLCCDNGGHKDAVISNGGGNSTIRHNVLECLPVGCSAAFGLFGDFAPIANWTIDHNLLITDEGGICLYGGHQPGKRYPTATNVDVINNRFSRLYNPRCGFYNPAAYWGGNGSTWSGNVWDDTGLPVPAP